MRLILLVVCVTSITWFAQRSISQVPEEVNIKVASDADNASAKAAPQEALVDDISFPKELLGDTATCGPTLWATLKGSADETLLHSKVITAVLSVPEPLQTVGRGLVTEEQRKAFWKLLRAKYPALKTAIVQKASAEEVRYYWAYDSL
jgi:hypothetical protein